MDESGSKKESQTVDKITHHRSYTYSNKRENIHFLNAKGRKIGSHSKKYAFLVKWRPFKVKCKFSTKHFVIWSDIEKRDINISIKILAVSLEKYMSIIFQQDQVD